MKSLDQKMKWTAHFVDEGDINPMCYMLKASPHIVHRYLVQEEIAKP